MDQEVLKSVAEVKVILGVSHTGFYRLIARKELSAIKIGRNTKVRLSELKRFMAARPDVVSRMDAAA